MGLFGKKKELPPLLSDAEIDAELEPCVNFNSVVTYLEGLSRYDYDKILKVVNIYREANKSASKVLGIKDEPSTTIDKESRSEATLDDDLPFLEDDVPPLKTEKKPKQ